MRKKTTFLIFSIISFLFSLLLSYYGFVAFRIGAAFSELNVELPLYTHLWITFWWLPPIIFLALAIWLFSKYKKT